MRKNAKNRDDELIVHFRGEKLNKDQTKQTGIAIIIGIIGVAISFFIFGKEQRLFSLILIGYCTAIGFLGFRFIEK
jgi:hypothetical protein